MADVKQHIREGRPGAKAGKRGGKHGGPTGPGGKFMPGEKASDFKGTILTLAGYLKPYTLQLIIVFVTAILSTAFAIISPVILGNATDIVANGITGKGMDYVGLRNILLVLLGLYGASWLFGAVQSWIMAVVSQKVIYTLRDKMSKKLDRLPLRYFDRVPYGEVQSRMINDIETINQTLSASITQIITAVVTLIGILVMMISISPIMTLAAVLVIPASMIVIKVVVGKSQGYFRNQQQYLGKVNSHVEEMYAGHDIVKAFNREEMSEAEFNEYNEKLCEAGWKSQFLSALMMPLTQLIGNLAYVMVCFFGGYLAIKGRISIGQIQAFIQYVRSFNQPVQQVANITNQLQSTAAAAERVFQLIDEEEEADAYKDTETEAAGGEKEKEAASGENEKETTGSETDVESAGGETEAETAGGEKEKETAGSDTEAETAGGEKEKETAGRENEKEAASGDTKAEAAGGETADIWEECEGNVSFENVSFGYLPGEPVIRDFSFHAKAGQRIAIVGPTGAGKTTIVKLLMRYYELDGGRISVDGCDITEMSRHQLRSCFGMVLQDTWLNSSTIRENIRYGRKNATDEEVEAAAYAAHIDHFIRTLPGGYDMKINEEATNISAGQKQLLTIARAILADAPILILDEATSSVDTRTERIIQKAMGTLMEGRTSFIIAHRLSTIKDADHILVMNHGDIVEQGNHEELLARNGFYAELYNSQFADRNESMSPGLDLPGSLKERSEK